MLGRLASAQSLQQEVNYLRAFLEQLAVHQQVGWARAGAGASRHGRPSCNRPQHSHHFTPPAWPCAVAGRHAASGHAQLLQQR